MKKDNCTVEVNCTLNATVGTTEKERMLKPLVKVLVMVVLQSDNKDITNYLDYSKIAEIIKTESSFPHLLLENFAGAIADSIENQARHESIEIKIVKLNPLLAFPGQINVGITFKRQNINSNKI